MIPIDIGRRRPYRSELRASQAAETQARILDATVRLTARGLATLSIPAVAREAGVSVATIYRHFGSKHALLAALYPHLARRTGLDKVEDPRSLDELRDAVRHAFDRIESMDDLARAALASPIGSEVRRATAVSRYQRVRRLADSIEPPLPEADRDRITRLLVILTSSPALRVWRDVISSTVEQAADDVDWIVRAAISASRRESR